MRNVSVSLVVKLVLISLSIGTVWAAPDPASKASELFPDVPVVKGKGFQIKRSQLDDAVTSIKSTAVARGQSIPPDQIAMMEQQVLERLIQIQILLAKATDADKAKGEETSSKRFENVKIGRAHV